MWREGNKCVVRIVESGDREFCQQECGRQGLGSVRCGSCGTDLLSTESGWQVVLSAGL